LDGVEFAGIESQRLKDGGSYLGGSTKLVTVLGAKLGFESSMITLVSS
jgi:hypothetical protein